MVRSSSSMPVTPGSACTTSRTSAFSRSSTTMPRSLTRPLETSSAMSMPAVRGSALSAARPLASSARSARNWRDRGVSWNSFAFASFTTWSTQAGIETRSVLSVKS